MLTSQVGGGSRFSVEIPLAVALPSEKKAQPRLTANRNLNDMLVLAIDNEPNILSGMDALLAGWNCRILTALDPHSGAMQIQDLGETPDVLLIDYHLDDCNGIEAVGELRWKFGADIPAILITADRTPAVRKEAAARDIYILNKPVKPAALRAHLVRTRNLQRQIGKPAAE
jgi:CheY-like chemotaxis protein